MFNGTNMTLSQAPSVPQLYRHLTFSHGWHYAPQPQVPYAPASLPHLAVHLPGLANSTVPRASKMVQPGSIGAGARASDSTFRFNVYSAHIGCDNTGPLPCMVVFTGYSWSDVNMTEVAINTLNATVAPCPLMHGCKLTKINFGTNFTSLTDWSVDGSVGNTTRAVFIDSLHLGWTNESCGAGLQRLNLV